MCRMGGPFSIRAPAGGECAFQALRGRGTGEWGGLEGAERGCHQAEKRRERGTSMT